MNVLFTSDLHINHLLASDKRGFKSVTDHDDSIIETLNKYCNKRTLLYVLGDVAMSRSGLARLKDVGGRKILIKGNHDQYKLAEYIDIFEDIHGIIKYKNMWLSHCPIHPQEMWRCDANVHGHIHKNAATSNIGDPYLNVNWDYWRRPLELNEIKEMVKAFKK